MRSPLQTFLLTALSCACQLSAVQSASLPAQERKNQECIDLKMVPSKEFLAIVRHAPSREIWTKLSGKAQHRRTGEAVLTSTIRLGIRFTPDRIIGQLVLDGTEIYNLGQTLSDPPRATRMLAGRALDKDKAKLGVFGLSADDLLMGFMYREMVREDAMEKVSLYDCRVFTMHADAGEFARVAISTDYVFPLRVEWFKKDPGAFPQEKPYRTLEIVSIQEIRKDFVLISKLRLDGPGWRTRIDFDELDAGYASDSIPTDLFLDR